MRESMFGRIVLAAIVSAAVLLPAPDAAVAQKRGGTLVQITQPEPPTLALYVNTANPVAQVASKVYDGLLEYGFDMKPQPSLAEAWTVAPDGKTITFKLRHGVKFHDGKPFTSADVQFSIMEILKKVNPRGTFFLRDVTAVETPDAQTAILKLRRPAPYLMMALSGADSPMLPKHLFSTGDIRNHEYANKPVGTGPFKFVEWRRGEFVRLDRNVDYWRPGEPYLDRIVVRFVPDAATRTALLEKGEAHVAGFGAIPYSDVKRLAALPTVDVTTRGYEMVSAVVELTMNTKRPPFDNPKVRQAVSYAVDRQFLIDSIWFGYGKPATGPMNSNFKALGLYSADVHNYNVPNRVEIANKLLDEAGYPRKADGTRFAIVYDVIPYGEDWQRLGEAVQQHLAQVGIKVTLRVEDVPTWLKRIYTDYDFNMNSVFMFNLSDPVLGMHRGLHSSFIQQGTVFVNVSRWSSPRADELMDKATVELDPVKRGAYYAELLRIVAAQAPSVWITELQYATIVNKRYHDVIVSPVGVYGAFNRAWVDR